jgi:putative membrane protein
MVTDHNDAVSIFETESTSGQDPQLKDFATTTLPIIKEHLALAKQLAASGG